MVAGVVQASGGGDPFATIRLDANIDDSNEIEIQVGRRF